MERLINNNPEEKTEKIVQDLISESIRPVSYPDQIKKSVNESIKGDNPLYLRMVLCPNWQVDKTGRSIGEIPVTTDGQNLLVGNPNSKIVSLLSEEVPELVNYLNHYGINIKLLVVLADILSPNWVHDPKSAKEKLAQNQKAIKLLLLSSQKGKEIFNDKTKAEVKVASQLQLATNTRNYKKRLIDYQKISLIHGTDMNNWYLETVKQLQQIGEYSDSRNDLAGMKKIWDRALFLASIYVLDGEVIESDMVLSGLSKTPNIPCVALGTVASRHGDIISQGLNLNRKNPIGVISPYKNSMDHSWEEPAKSCLKLQ